MRVVTIDGYSHQPNRNADPTKAANYTQTVYLTTEDNGRRICGRLTPLTLFMLQIISGQPRWT
jgi:hypothetical protein